MGVVTGSADQTVRRWVLPPEPDPSDLPQPPLTLLTPTRTLRGHSESVTCLELLRGPGVTMAATGAKDRTVRLWGLALLAPSPANKPSIATLRGHGAPVSCLAAVCDPGRQGEGGEATALLSAGWDGRAKLWDVWGAGACIQSWRLAGPASLRQSSATGDKECWWGVGTACAPAHGEPGGHEEAGGCMLGRRSTKQGKACKARAGRLFRRQNKT